MFLYSDKTWVLDQCIMHFTYRSCLSRKLEKKFDLYYYDGLARQDEEIRLTVGKELQHCRSLQFIVEIVPLKPSSFPSTLFIPVQV